MKDFIAYLQRSRAKILQTHGDARAYCTRLLKNSDAAGLPDRILKSFADASADDREYAIACAYSLLIDEDRRKELSAYFTPPSLVRAALAASEPFLSNSKNPTVLDPACGGGSFLTPVARLLIERQRKQNTSIEEICCAALKNIRGIEIDSALATLSQALLRKALKDDYGFARKGPLGVVRRADALSSRINRKFDLVIGNPPYGKVRKKVATKILKAAGLANLGGHTNLYSLFLLHGLDRTKPGGGLVYVLPTSFVAGPYFAGLRHEIIKRAEVSSIDLHEQREHLFVGAVQDVCLLTLKKRDAEQTTNTSHEYRLGYIDADGKRTSRGFAVANAGGEPWTLPVAHEVRVFASRATAQAEPQRLTLAEYGYIVRVGKVVPNREKRQLHTKKKPGDLPLVWASNVRPDGTFNFWSSRRLENAPWYKPPNPKRVHYATTKPAVVVQRTSNRDQSRRLNATVVPAYFRKRHKRGFIAENHVIVIESRTVHPLVPLKTIAALLNSQIVNERFSAVAGSFSVSAKLLQRMALPDWNLVKELGSEKFEHELRTLFEGLGDVLVAASNSPSDAKDGIDESRKLDSRLAVYENARLKRRAVA